MEHHLSKIRSKEHLSKSELKLEAEYEDKLVVEFKRHHLFEGRYADKLITLINDDVASSAIESSLLDVFVLGNESVRRFMYDRLVAVDGGEKPAIAYSSRLPRSNAQTFANLFDVEIKTDLTEKKIGSVNRKILQRFVTAYHAGRVVVIFV